MAEHDSSNESRRLLRQGYADDDNMQDIVEQHDRYLFGGPRSGEGLAREFERFKLEHETLKDTITEAKITVRVTRQILAFFGLTSFGGVMALIYLLMKGAPK